MPAPRLNLSRQLFARRLQITSRTTSHCDPQRVRRTGIVPQRNAQKIAELPLRQPFQTGTQKRQTMQQRWCLASQNQKPQQLNEGLRARDLKDFVSELFTVDQYRSKMGEDKDIVVLGFRVTEKNPAADLMEFMERGYRFILDADMSAGEENDGKYQVFVEIERTPELAEQLKDLQVWIKEQTKVK